MAVVGTWFSKVQEGAPVSEWKGVTASNDKGEVLGIDLHAVDPDLTARHRIPNLEHLDFRGFSEVSQQYLCQIAKDYVRNKSLCVDFQGILKFGDADLHIFVETRVQWHKLNIGGTSATEAGIHTLSKSCPDLLVK